MTDIHGAGDGASAPTTATDRDAVIRGALRPAAPLATRVNRNVLVVAAVIMAATVISAVVLLNPNRESTAPAPQQDVTPTREGTPPSFPTFLNTPPQTPRTSGETDSSDLEHTRPGTDLADPDSLSEAPGTSPHMPSGPARDRYGVPSFDQYPSPASAPPAPPISPRLAAHAKALTRRPSIDLADTRASAPAVGAPRSPVLDPTLATAGDESMGASALAPASPFGYALPNTFAAGSSSSGSPASPSASGKASHNAFLHDARTASPSSSAITSALSPAPSRYAIQAGTVIPGLLITGINSDLPGQILAQVARDVYDSPTQRVVLIPKGAKLLATYDNEIIAGQNRALVAFTRVIFPDGRSIALPGLGITDVEGAAGVRDRVDNHYRRVFGNAVLLSVLGAGAQLSQPRQGSSVWGPPSAGQVAAGAVGQELADVAAAIVRRNLEIQPTIEIRPGTPFNVFLNGDLTFDGPYVDARAR